MIHKYNMLYSKLVLFVLMLLYFFQVNIAQAVGLENRIFNYILVLLYLYFFVCFRPTFRQYKDEYYILFVSLLLLISRYIMGMFEETFQTLINLMMPALLLMIIHANEFQRRNLQIKSFLVSYFVFNCLIAIFEFIIRGHLIGWHDTAYSDGELVSYVGSSDFRSVALSGSPLSNALNVTILSSFFLFSNFNEKKKFYLFFVGLIAVLCFNARSAFVVHVIVFICFIIKNFKQYRIGQKIAILFGVLISSILILYLLYNTNMGSRLMSTTSDDESINVRLMLFEKISNFNYQELLWGDTLENVRWLMDSMGVVVIENFWIAYILHFGIIAVIVFTLLYIKLILKLFKNYPLYDKLVLSLCFIVLASTNNSLYSSYIPLFSFLMCAFIFRPCPSSR